MVNAARPGSFPARGAPTRHGGVWLIYYRAVGVNLCNRFLMTLVKTMLTLLSLVGL